MAPRHFAPLKKFPNFYYLGDKSYDQLPIYLSNFDICIVPHIISEFTESMSPLKLFEYLAASKPVVATTASGINIDSRWLISTSNPESFLEGIQKLLHNKNEEKFIVPSAWTWPSKAEQVLSLIQKTIFEQKRTNGH